MADYDQGYARGWKDIHESTRWRRAKVRARWPEYAAGYEAGRIDGASHPGCPEWDDAHRVGRLADLPEACPWNPATAAATPGWEPVATRRLDLDRVSVAAVDIRRRRASLRPTAFALHPDAETPSRRQANGTAAA